MTARGVIFDGDDTLWETMPLYTAAKAHFYRRMAELGFVEGGVPQRFEDIDVRNLAVHGFGRRRFPSSMVETYRSCCRDTYQVPRPEEERALQAIGESVFLAQPQLFPGAREVLTALHGHYRVVLLTKGDPEVQRARVEQSTLSPLFAAIYIGPDKTAEDFARVIAEQDLDANRSWSVGNSVRADINPALNVGLSAVWIPYTTWDAEHDREVASPQLHRASSLRECLRWLLPG